MSAPKGTRPWNAGRAQWRPNAQGYLRRQRVVNGVAIEERHARVVMARVLKRALTPTEHVWHRDGNRANDHPRNLVLTRRGGPLLWKMPRRALALALCLVASTAHAGWYVTKTVDCATAQWKAPDLIRVLVAWKVPFINVPTGDPTKIIIVYPMPNPPQVGERVLNVFVNDADFCAKWKGIGLAVESLVPGTSP